MSLGQTSHLDILYDQTNSLVEKAILSDQTNLQLLESISRLSSIALVIEGLKLIKLQHCSPKSIELFVKSTKQATHINSNGDRVYFILNSLRYGAPVNAFFLKTLCESIRDSLNNIQTKLRDSDKAQVDSGDESEDKEEEPHEEPGTFRLTAIQEDEKEPRGNQDEEEEEEDILVEYVYSPVIYQNNDKWTYTLVLKNGSELYDNQNPLFDTEEKAKQAHEEWEAKHLGSDKSYLNVLNVIMTTWQKKIDPCENEQSVGAIKLDYNNTTYYIVYLYSSFGHVLLGQIPAYREIYDPSTNKINESNLTQVTEFIKSDANGWSNNFADAFKDKAVYLGKGFIPCTVLAQENPTIGTKYILYMVNASEKVLEDTSEIVETIISKMAA